MPFHGFWAKIARPIVGLSPMDGVTDFAFRYIVARYGRPDVIFTEFTTAEGLFYAPERILRDFEYHESERPVVAQIYGNRPDDFYKATHVVCELGFDGVDINMGCPSRQVTQKNCGAKLITVPDLAVEIIGATRQALQDWASGQTLEDLKADSKMPEKVIRTVVRMNVARTGIERPAERRLIPYSVKTRIGYDSVVIEDWIKILLKTEPAAISIHGRTLKQMYKGEARWDAIAKAVEIACGSGTLILGNGDLTSLSMAEKAIRETGVDGVLIGRSSIGNPWVFQGRDFIPPSERFQTALEHAHYFETVRGSDHFRVIRKHLVHYLSHFPEATSYRVRALETKNYQELEQILARPPAFSSVRGKEI